MTTASLTTPTSGVNSARRLRPALDLSDVPIATATDDAAESLATMFKALADPARVKIMTMLLNAEEICACDVATGIGKTAATASHHLKLLRDVGLVTCDKRGTWVYYRAVPARLTAIGDALRPTH
ncbi:transcriptional regulator [Cryobacterium cheniae]|uniref:Transcriptional regulator n=1 Tax=Cryobacterium cheniae TaxID=1259262 RepID=A0A4R8XM75_9MICO|nr:metalloregulator ArsR/SmtB family transcription factor [Cryobacterium cheniae]TFC76611.1 transcriptional regulator [Cryobacterium cheniae]